MEAPLGPRANPSTLALLHMNPITQVEEARTSHLGASNRGRAGVALPMPKFTLAREQSVPENRRAVFNFEQEVEQARNWWLLPPINAPPRGSPTRIDEVAVFKAQVVAPTLAALLVNLDQEDRLVLQVPSRHDRPGRLWRQAHPFLLWVRAHPSLPSIRAHPYHL